MVPTGHRSATSWVRYTTSCNTQPSAPEDGQNICPKHVELTGIINKPLLLQLVGCLHYLYQWCTVKQISDNEIYLLNKYIKSLLWRVAKRLSYIEDARCLKVNFVLPALATEICSNMICMLLNFWHRMYTGCFFREWPHFEIAAVCDLSNTGTSTCLFDVCYCFEHFCNNITLLLLVLPFS